MNSLADFVRQIRNQKGLSVYEVSKRSGRFGKRICPSYVSRIENSPNVRVTADRLAALAHGLGIPPQEIFARAVGSVPSIDEVHLLTRFRELSPERRSDVLDIVQMLYERESSRPNLYIVRGRNESKDIRF